MSGSRPSLPFPAARVPLSILLCPVWVLDFSCACSSGSVRHCNSPFPPKSNVTCVLFGIIESHDLRGRRSVYIRHITRVTAERYTVRYTLPPTGACIAIWPGMRAWLGPGHTTIRRGSPIATGGSAPGHKPGTRRAIARGVLSYHHSNPPCLRLAACCRVHRRSFSLLSSSQT